jgi:hypothetical protein
MLVFNVAAMLVFDVAAMLVMCSIINGCEERKLYTYNQYELNTKSV